jgi:biotin synthase-like enzyme
MRAQLRAPRVRCAVRSRSRCIARVHAPRAAAARPDAWREALAAVAAASARGVAPDALLLAAASAAPLSALMLEAAALRDAAFGSVVTFSPKVFIPLTRLCRDACGYCTFSAPPRAGAAPYMSLAEVLAVARAGAAAGATEVRGPRPTCHAARDAPAREQWVQAAAAARERPGCSLTLHLRHSA